MREIGRRLGLARSTVQDYLDRAAREQVVLAPELDLIALECRLFPRSPRRSEARAEPDWTSLFLALMRPDVTLRAIWLDQLVPGGSGWSYGQMARHYRAWLARQPPIMRLGFRAGAVIFVDLLQIADVVGSGHRNHRPRQVFIAMLGASGLLYTEEVVAPSLAAWLELQDRTLTYFGGVPRSIGPGFTRANRASRRWGPGAIDPEYREWARRWGTRLLPTLALRPAAALAAMAGPGQLVEAMHRLPIGGAAAHPVEFRAALAAATSDLNGATLGEVGLSRLDLFQMVERPCLLPIGPVARRRDSEGAQEEPV